VRQVEGNIIGAASRIMFQHSEHGKSQRDGCSSSDTHDARHADKKQTNEEHKLALERPALWRKEALRPIVMPQQAVQ
jgi:hypothetical protein